MKRPSTLILSFILAVAGIFIAYGLGRIFFRAIRPPKPEVEIEDELQLYNYHHFPQILSPKIASQKDSNKPI